MTSNLVLHPQTAAALKRLDANPPHALLLVGSVGSGRGAIASEFAATLLQTASIETNPYFKRVLADDGIEAVRDLQSFASLKVPGHREGINRVAVIESAEQFGVEAQNAFLKLLEEPPRGMLLILTASHADALLPTIQSRVQLLPVLAPLGTDLEKHLLAKGYQPEQIRPVILMAGGLPGLALALLGQDTSHPLFAAADQARQILRQTTFERLAAVDGLSKKREMATQTATMLAQMAGAALRQMSQTPSPEAAKRVGTWQRILTAADTAISQLQKNAQPKLVLTQLMLAL